MTLSPAGFLRIGASDLEYRMIGAAPDQAPTIVMLHEGLGSVGLWGDFPDRLAAATGTGVLVYSRAGYGASTPVKLPRPRDYMHIEALDVLPKLPRPAARAFRRRVDRGDLCRRRGRSPRARRGDDRAAFCRRGYFGDVDRRDQEGLRDHRPQDKTGALAP
jgi:pimeloyl-ACP methyl ester carboxylesterase